MSKSAQIYQQLNILKEIMQQMDLWQQLPPEAKAFESNQPFALDTMEGHEWLQWVFIPRIHALLEMDKEINLPYPVAICPYLEESFKDIDEVHSEKVVSLMENLKKLEVLLNNE